MEAYKFTKISFDVMQDVCDYCAKKAAFYEERSSSNTSNLAKAIVYREIIKAVEKRDSETLPWENSVKIFQKEVAPLTFGNPK